MSLIILVNLIIWLKNNNKKKQKKKININDPLKKINARQYYKKYPLNILKKSQQSYLIKKTKIK